jgi:hypothetical protein
LQKVLLGVGSASVIAIGGWTATTLSDLTTEVQALRMSMVEMTAKVNGMPPKDLLLRIERLEQDGDKMEKRFELLMNRVHRQMGVD